MKIIGTGSCVPEKVVTNADLAAFLDTSDEWITTRTGIKERRVLSGEGLEQLAAKAAQNALDMAGLGASQVDYILCANVYGPYMTPSLACIVEGMIGANCPCADLNAACTGYLYALDMADGLLATGRYQNILVLCAEANSALADWRDRATCVLFGDGAAATLVTGGGPQAHFRMSSTSNTEVLYYKNQSGNCPYTPRHEMHYLAMNGQEVYKFAVHAAVEDLRAVIAAGGCTEEQVDYFLLHQANLRIVESARGRLGQPREKFPTNIERYGNTSSASIPLLIDELSRGGCLQKGDLLAMSAFGAGLTTGACLLRWDA